MMKALLFAFASAAVFAQELKITAGAVDYQVFQRDAENRASILLRGEAAAAGKTVQASLATATPPKKVVAKAEAAIGGGQWTMTLTAPVGGPYTLTVLSNNGKPVTVKNLLVGDLWILAGQSNMEGVGDLVDVQPPDVLVNSFDQSDQWINAKEPLHSLPSAVDPVHWRKNAQGQIVRLEGEALQQFIANRKKGAGLGLPFAVDLVRRTGVPVGLVPCGHGGTSMDQWNPALKDKGGNSLYGATLRRFQAVGGKVTGVLWYQGESDANPKAAPVFQEKFEKLVAALRADFGQSSLPFYYVQIGRHVSSVNVAEWNAVQEMQRKAEAMIPRSGMVPAIDVALDDGIHVSTQDQKLIGKRLAALALRDLFPKLQGPKRGPRLASVHYADGVVRVTFNEVNGKLVSDGRIAGFSIHNAKGEAVPAIFKSRVDPQDTNSVLLSISGKLPDGASLRYGYGKDPYCNLRDEAGMGVPVFGPEPIQ
jgi:sialate O-acetylesterase